MGDAALIDPHAPLLATYGSLLCTASYSAAQNGNTAQAIGLIEEAEHAARRLPGTANGSGNAQFSESTVAVYRIGVHTALGDSAKALSYFASVEPGTLPTAERRARSYVDGARAWKEHGNLEEASNALNLAFACAPQELKRAFSAGLDCRHAEHTWPDTRRTASSRHPRWAITGSSSPKPPFSVDERDRRNLHDLSSFALA